MKLFNKEPKFILIQCQKCGGSLELDTNYETAHCTNCGMQYVVQNVNKKKQLKRTKFEMVMDYIEKDRDLKRKDKIEKTKIRQDDEILERKTRSRVAWICGLILIIMLISSIVLSSLGILE